MRLKLQHRTSFSESPHAMWVRVGLAGILVCLGKSVLLSQDAPDNAQNIRFVINTGGCEQQIRTVRFSADSTRVYAAGNDKRVFVWNLLPDATGHLARQVPANSYFWEQSRGHRSVIENFELSPKNGQLAVCGQGARSYGDIVLFDVQSGKVAGILPAERPAGLGEDNSHISSVVDVDWSPSGSQLASVDVSGRVHIWNAIDRTHNRTFDTDNLASFERRQVTYLDDETLLISQLSAAGGRVGIVDLSQDVAEPKYLPTVHPGLVLALAALPTTDRWVSSDQKQNLHFWKRGELVQTVSLNEPDHPNELGRMAVSLHFGGPTGRYLLANVHVIMKNQTRHAELQVWDALQNPPTRIDTLDVPGRPALTAAISSDELLVASVDDLQNTIHVFELNNDGTFAKRNDQPIKLTLRGTASPVRSVAFSADDSLRVRFTTIAEPARPRVFNLKSAMWEANPQVVQTQWLNSRISPDGWAIRVTEAAPATIELLENGQPRGTIALDPVNQGLPATYALIADGNPQRTRAIAIGTRLYGIYIYEIPRNGRCRLLRYYRDHSGPISSLSVSQDRKYLASGSDDATVKIWSLNRLFDKPPVDFPTAAAWGGRFIVRDGKLVTGPLIPGGIAAARGLEEGDVVERLKVRKLNENAELVVPAQMLDAIRSVNLWQQLEFQTSRNGKQRPRFNIVPGWEPIASFLVDRRNEWAIWTPRGNYNASAAGDQLFGWIENPGPAQRGGTPKFSPAKTKRGDFERPELLRGLFADARIPERPVVDIPLIEKQPLVRIISPTWDKIFEGDNPVSVIADVVFPGRPEQYVTNAFANLSPLGAPIRTEHQPDGAIRYQWQFTPQLPFNRLLVQTHRRNAHAAISNHVDAVAYFRTRPRIDPRIIPPDPPVVPPVIRPSESELPRLFLAGIAVALAYGDTPNPSYPPLKAPLNDWHQIKKVFEGNAGHHYTLGHSTWELLEHNVTKKQFTEWVARIRQDLDSLDDKLRPTDLFVLAVGGHGVGEEAKGPSHDDNFFFIGSPVATETGEGGNVRWSHDRIPWVPTDGSENDEGTFHAFADLPCRKFIILDACFSGKALDAQNSRLNRWKVPVRTLQSKESLVFVATGSDDESFEFEGTSAFSQVFAHGVNGAADGFSDKGHCAHQDKTVKLAEALYYTSHMTQYLTTDLEDEFEVEEGCETNWQQPESGPLMTLVKHLKSSLIIKLRAKAQVPEMSLTGTDLLQFADIPLVELTEN